MMLFVVFITLPLARHVVEPIKLIAHGMNRLTQGDYKQSIDLHRSDELGELSRDYNELALTLAENESARKRWLANISHELRTPVAILSLELEAMLDGIRPMTKENVLSANDELKHLAKLIDDLHQLTIADVGGMQYTKLNEDITLLINGEKNKYQSYLADKNIALTLDLLNDPLYIYGDRTRLFQLFENIINNSIKYSEANTVKISSRITDSHSGNLTESTIKSFVILTFEDDGVGVEEQHLPHLFEYLYRTDESRNRKTGGAGIGLSICNSIVIAHQGEILASKSSLGGLAITIKLPIVPS
jgi:two-component system sensor histidine kinase BaeS